MAVVYLAHQLKHDLRVAAPLGARNLSHKKNPARTGKRGNDIWEWA
jgi:hypothetical protein